MTQHARLSPSGADRWFACPGAPNAEKGLPDKESEAAFIGTVAHEVLELSLRSQTEPKKAAGHLIYADPEMLNHIKRVYRRLIALIPEGAGTHIEKRVNAGKAIGREDLFGTTDFVIDAGDHLYVIDLKYGTKKIRAENNRQLLIYAIGVIETLGVHPEKITLMIEQPRVKSSPDTWTITREELNAFKAVLAKRAAATDHPAAPRIAGDWCYWCKAWNVCDARKEQLVRKNFSDIDPDEIEIE